MPEWNARYKNWSPSPMTDSFGDQKSYCKEPMLYAYDREEIDDLLRTFDVLCFNLFGEMVLMAAVNTPVGTLIASYYAREHHFKIYPPDDPDTTIFSDTYNLEELSRDALEKFVIDRLRDKLTKGETDE